MNSGRRLTCAVPVGGGAVMQIANPHLDDGVEWNLRYGSPYNAALSAASLIGSYTHLISPCITTKEAIRRIRILRKAFKEKTDAAE